MRRWSWWTSSTAMTNRKRAAPKPRALLTKYPDLRAILAPTSVGVEQAAKAVEAGGVYPGGTNAKAKESWSPAWVRPINFAAISKTISSPLRLSGVHPTKGTFPPIWQLDWPWAKLRRNQGVLQCARPRIGTAGVREKQSRGRRPAVDFYQGQTSISTTSDFEKLCMGIQASYFVMATGLLSNAIAENAAPVRSQLTIRADRPQGTINRNIYGQFSEHLGRCIYEGIWVGEDSPIPNTRGIRNDVVAAPETVEPSRPALAGRLFRR